MAWDIGEEKKKPVKKTSSRTLIQFGEAEAGSRITQPSETQYARKPFLRLEQLYSSDPLIFNMINTWVELICSPGFRIEHENEAVRKEFSEWMEEIEFRDEKLPIIAQHEGIYGNAYSEIVFNVKGTDIVDLSRPVDPKTIRFKKDTKGNPILDKHGNPSMYVQFRPSSGKPTDIPAENLAHFKLYTLGSSQLGIGFIEPLFWTALGKRNLDEKIAQQEFRRASPFVLARIGDKDHPPSAQEIDDVHKALKNITYKTDFVGPYWYNIEFIKTDPSESSLGAANYFVNQIASGSGLPKAFITGVTEQQNRATLQRIEALAQRKVQRIQRSISGVMENQVFKQKMKLKFPKEKKVPKMIWNEFSRESLTDKIDRLTKEIQVGLVEPDDALKEMIREMEGLPVVKRTRETLEEKK